MAALPVIPLSSPNVKSLAKWLPLLVAALAGLLVAGAYFLLYRPKISDLMAGGRLDLQPLNQRLADDQALARQVDDSLSAYGRLNEEHRLKVQKAMPLDADVTSIIMELDGIARANGMALMSIDATPEEKATASRRLVRISAELRGGDYVQFKLLLADVERSIRPLDVRSIVFNSPGGSYGLTMSGYWLDPAVTKSVIPAAAPAPVPTED